MSGYFIRMLNLLKKNVFSIVVWCSVFYMSSWSLLSTVLFKFSVFLLSSAYSIIIEKHVKSPTMIVNFYIS